MTVFDRLTYVFHAQHMPLVVLLTTLRIRLCWRYSPVDGDGVFGGNAEMLEAGFLRQSALIANMGQGLAKSDKPIRLGVVYRQAI